jgi:hypothetical protein
MVKLRRAINDTSRWYPAPTSVLAEGCRSRRPAAHLAVWSLALPNLTVPYLQLLAMADLALFSQE